MERGRSSFMIALKIHPMNIKNPDGDYQSVGAFFDTIPTDDKLDETSLGAVQNKVVTQAIKELNDKIGNLESIERVEY